VEHDSFVLERGIYAENSMAGRKASVRVEAQLVDEAAKLLGVNSRAAAAHIALREIVALKDFQKLMRRYAGKLEFAAVDGARERSQRPSQ
jgi:hypothetical protein